MRTRRLILLLLASLALVSGAILFLTASREPSYQGRALTQWCEVARSSRMLEVVDVSDSFALFEWNSSDRRARRGLDHRLRAKIMPSPAQKEADKAIEAIGTNALPFLLRWLHYEDTKTMQHLQKTYRRITAFLHFEPHWNPAGRAEAAKTAFRILGPRARGTIPQLVQMMNNPKEPDTARRAGRVLIVMGAIATQAQRANLNDDAKPDPDIGADLLPSLMGPLTNAQHPLHLGAVGAMAWFPRHARPAIPALIKCLQETNRIIVITAISDLGRLHLEPQTVVPALARSLENPDHLVRGEALCALANFGKEARPAVTHIFANLHDKDMQIRADAIDALRAIAPEALTNSPPK